MRCSTPKRERKGGGRRRTRVKVFVVPNRASKSGEEHEESWPFERLGVATELIRASRDWTPVNLLVRIAESPAASASPEQAPIVVLGLLAVGAPENRSQDRTSERHVFMESASSRLRLEEVLHCGVLESHAREYHDLLASEAVASIGRPAGNRQFHAVNQESVKARERKMTNQIIPAERTEKWSSPAWTKAIIAQAEVLTSSKSSLSITSFESIAMEAP